MSNKLKLPWVRKRRRSEPELPLKAPLHLGAISNGEMFRPDTPLARKVERLIMEKAEEGAKRHNIERREFLASSMGMATTLWAINLANGCSSESSGGSTASSGNPPTGSPTNMPPGYSEQQAMQNLMQNPVVPPASSGGGMTAPPGAGPMAGAGATPPNQMPGGMGGNEPPQTMMPPADPESMFNVPADPTDLDIVCQTMLDPSKEFIFDIQTHHVYRADTSYTDFLRDQIQFSQHCRMAGLSELSCFGLNEYVRLMFLESDTTVAVLSGLPAATMEGNPITNAEIAQSRDAINMMADGSQRLVNHHMVLPNRTGVTADAVKAELDQMAVVLNEYKIGAWKAYTGWDPRNTEASARNGYFMDDEATGIRFIEEGLRLGVGTFCIHKGLPIPGFSTEYNYPDDIGRVAKAYPEANFIVYHSGFGNNNAWTEGPYSPGSKSGINSLITSLQDAGIEKGSNVYAELGTTWQLLSTGFGFGVPDPTMAAHGIGKLLKHVGEDNIVWGTDSIWYGSPQGQIEAFLQFQIPMSLQQSEGYPPLTMEAKRKILGLNAARVYGVDPVATRCAIQQSGAQQAKLLLNEAIGGRRWTLEKPMLYSKRRFWELLRRDMRHKPA